MRTIGRGCSDTRSGAAFCDPQQEVRGKSDDDVGAEAEIGFGSRAHVDGLLAVVEFEDNALALAHEHKNRAFESVGSHHVIGTRRVARDNAFTRDWVVAPDDALHAITAL